MTAKVKIGKAIYPVAFSNLALAKFLREEKLTLADLSTDIAARLDYLSTLRMVYRAFEDGARKDGQNLELTFEQVCDLIDGKPELMNQVMEVINESLAVQTAGAEKGQAEGN